MHDQIARETRSCPWILNHSSYQFTGNLYEHVYETVTEEATEQLSEFPAAS